MSQQAPLSESESSTPSRILSQSSNMSSSNGIIDPVHIFDSIHGYIEIPDRIKPIIDTPHFQRLRQLKQLGASYYVFPGAAHNRFEHSIGVMHLGIKLLTHLKTRQESLIIGDKELFCVAAAGLLHDLGHGPFSHVFDHEFVPSITHCKFRHEDMSVKLIKDLFHSNDIAISDEELLLIQALVSPSTHAHIVKQYKEKNQGFLFEIIANEISGIDVDKWDYFMRDSKCIGLGISFTYDRLKEHARVIEDHICYHEKTGFELYLMFRTRYELFKRVYSHKASKACEYMLCDIMKLANGVFEITKKIDDPQDYLQLTDNIIYAIEWAPIKQGKNNKEREDAQNLQKAQKLIKRLHKRQLYKCCGYVLVPPTTIAQFNPTDNNDNKYNIDIINQLITLKIGTKSEIMYAMDSVVNRNDINEITDYLNKKQVVGQDENEEDEMKSDHDMNETTHHPKIRYHDIERKWQSEMFEIFEQDILSSDDKENIDERLKLEQSDIIIQLMSLSFGMETRHPIEQVFLYNSAQPDKCKQVGCDQITTLQDSSKFREVVVRAYVKKAEWKDECRRAFTKLMQNTNIMAKGDNEMNQFSLGISPQTKKPKKRLQRNNTDNLLSTKLEFSTPPPSKKKSISVLGKRKRESTQSTTVSLLDSPPRNKKAKHK